MRSYTKEEARAIAMQCAKLYNKRLVERKFIFIYRDKVDNNIKFFEVYFGKENYQHLTGLELLDKEGKVRDMLLNCFLRNALKIGWVKMKFSSKKMERPT